MATPRKSRKAVEETLVDQVVETISDTIEEIKEVPKKLGRVIEQSEYFKAIAQMRNKKK